jgi:site-specific DNA recombinase
MKTAIKFFIYIRKSTDDKTGKRQVLSLDAQLREGREVAKREGLAIADIIEETRTAKEPGRPLFNRMLDRIERGEANGILIWDIDRLYRNPADEGRVRWMLQRGIIASIKTPTRAYFPDDAGLLIAVEGGRSTDFIIHLKRNISRGVDEKLLRGEWPGSNKPIGYIYDRELRNIVPDPKRAKIVQAIFEEVSEGRRGLMWVSDFLAASGVVSKNGNRWTKSQVHSLLTNRLYMGVMVWKGKAHQGRYKPIISAELFKKVQDALKVRSKPRHTRAGHRFPFCGLFRCTCDSMVSAQWAKGHGGLYRYYRCTRKKGVCGEPYTQEKSVTEQCLALLKPLAIMPEEADRCRALIDAETDKEADAAETGADAINDRLSKIQEKLNKLTKGYLNELVDEESYKSATTDLITEKTALKQEKQRLQKTGSSYWNEPAKAFINALEMAGKTQTDKSPKEIAALVHKVGTNRLLSRKTVSFSFSEPYDFTASLLASRHDATSQNSSSHCDANHGSSIWCIRQDLNLQPSDPKSEALSN